MTWILVNLVLKIKFYKFVSPKSNLVYWNTNTFIYIFLQRSTDFHPVFFIAELGSQNF